MFRHSTLLLVLALAVGCGKTPVEKSSAEPEGEAVIGAEAVMERVGPGWAVEGYEASGRIKLSEKAVHRLELSVSKAAFFEGAVRIDLESLVEDRGENFVYVQEPDGWLKKVPVKVGPRSGAKIPVLSGLAPGTLYLAKGAPLVRLAELDLVSGEEVE